MLQMLLHYVDYLHVHAILQAKEFYHVKFTSGVKGVKLCRPSKKILCEGLQYGRSVNEERERERECENTYLFLLQFLNEHLQLRLEAFSLHGTFLEFFLGLDQVVLQSLDVWRHLGASAGFNLLLLFFNNFLQLLPLMLELLRFICYFSLVYLSRGKGKGFLRIRKKTFFSKSYFLLQLTIC